MLKSMRKIQKKSLVKSGLVLSLMTFASRIMGLVREMTKAAFLGTSAYADAFGIAFMIPNLFRRLFAENSISVAFIPTFRGYIEEDDSPEKHAETQQFVSATLTLVSFLTACVTVLGILLARFIVPFFYNSDADASLIAETTLLTRIMFPYLFVISAAAFFQGILNGCGIFAPSGFTPVLFNVIVVVITYALTPAMANPTNLPHEALAARANVLIRDIPVFDWLRRDVDCYMADDIDGFREKIKGICSGELPPLHENGYHAVEDKSIDQVALELKAVYEAALQK